MLRHKVVHNNNNHWSSMGASVATLEDVAQMLGVTKNKLGFLLGIASPNIYRWFTGNIRPSSVYCLRMLHLMYLKANNELDVDTFVPQVYWKWWESSERIKERFLNAVRNSPNHQSPA